MDKSLLLGNNWEPYSIKGITICLEVLHSSHTMILGSWILPDLSGLYWQVIICNLLLVHLEGHKRDLGTALISLEITL
jgi:hypothetical protein